MPWKGSDGYSPSRFTTPAALSQKRRSGGPRRATKPAGARRLAWIWMPWLAAWFKRRFGLLNTARGLLDEPAPVSSWLSSLLSVLLRWPGTDIKGASAAKLASAKTRVELLKAIHDRIVEQRLLYGERSGAPMYVVQTQEDRELVERPIRIAVVQPMLPRRDQFIVEPLNFHNF